MAGQMSLTATVGRLLPLHAPGAHFSVIQNRFEVMENLVPSTLTQTAISNCFGGAKRELRARFHDQLWNFALGIANYLSVLLFCASGLGLGGFAHHASIAGLL